jgi:hypothetical protein
VCVKPNDASKYDKLITKSFGELVDDENAVRASDYNYYQKLSWGFELYWNVHRDTMEVEIALVTKLGPGWLGIGFGTNGQMIGATSVVGWTGEDGIMSIQEYYLDAKLPWELKDTWQVTALQHHCNNTATTLQQHWDNAETKLKQHWNTDLAGGV